MNKPKTLAILVGILLSVNAIAQDKKAYFGVKSGINFTQYGSDANRFNYSLKPGFYAGGFFNLKIVETLQFQPELHFVLKGTGIKFENVRIPFSPNTFDAKYNINEFTVSLPLMLRLYTKKKFFWESGLHLDYIFNRTLTSRRVLLDGTSDQFYFEEYDNFDFGLISGIGFVLSEKLILNFRISAGLIKRDNDIKSLGLNLGLEYRI